MRADGCFVAVLLKKHPR